MLLNGVQFHLLYETEDDESQLKNDDTMKSQMQRGKLGAGVIMWHHNTNEARNIDSKTINSNYQNSSCFFVCFLLCKGNLFNVLIITETKEVGTNCWL